MDYNFLERMQNGEDPEEIAKELAAALNQAQEEYLKEQEEDEDEPCTKEEAADELAEHMVWFVRKYYPEVNLDEVDCSGDGVIKAMEFAIKLNAVLDKIDLGGLLETLS